ncbi:MAG: hypothetical protein ACFHVJ_14115 [Aestuariibacter sp.]
MNEVLHGISTTEIANQLMAYLLLTAHICMVLNLSKWQKNRGDQFTFVVASILAALSTVGFIQFINFHSVLIKHEVGTGFAFLLSILFTFTIPRLRKEK